jgi:hypothetical protein
MSSFAMLPSHNSRTIAVIWMMAAFPVVVPAMIALALILAHC